jgi:hypothetical protein
MVLPTPSPIILPMSFTRLCSLQDGSYALHHAVELGDLNKVQVLLEHTDMKNTACKVRKMWKVRIEMD